MKIDFKIALERVDKYTDFDHGPRISFNSLSYNPTLPQMYWKYTINLVENYSQYSMFIDYCI